MGDSYVQLVNLDLATGRPTEAVLVTTTALADLVEHLARLLRYLR